LWVSFFTTICNNYFVMENTTNIDLVIPYVNNEDVVWRNTYISFCKKNNLNNKIVDLFSNRFAGITFIYYQLQLVKKNMPWINKIYLLLSNKEQVIPSLLPKNCEIVLHEQFIPHNFLPTFNSTTIEMFLWNIKGLSEKFIYANDDMLPTGELKPSDFFKGDKIKIAWREDEFDPCSTVYAYQCYNNCLALSKKMNYKYPSNKMIRPVHSFTPMIKSHCESAYYLIKEYINPHIRAFRTEYQYNQYIYPIYEHWKYGTLPSDIDFLYTELDKEFDLNHQIVCVNCEKNKEYVDKFLREIKTLCK